MEFFSFTSPFRSDLRSEGLFSVSRDALHRTRWALLAFCANRSRKFVPRGPPYSSSSLIFGILLPPSTPPPPPHSFSLAVQRSVEPPRPRIRHHGNPAQISDDGMLITVITL